LKKKKYLELSRLDEGVEELVVFVQQDVRRESFELVKRVFLGRFVVLRRRPLAVAGLPVRGCHLLTRPRKG
jgi:hypothetical protein